MTTAALLDMYPGKETPPSVFWALDSRLPMLASKAAVEFDWLLQNRRGIEVPGRTDASIKQLLAVLENSAKGSSHAAEEEKGFVDPLGLNLFARAYNETHKAHPLKTREDLESAIERLTASLKQVQEGEVLEEQELRDIMTFCVALSGYASAYRKMVYGNRREHPYRK